MIAIIDLELRWQLCTTAVLRQRSDCRHWLVMTLGCSSKKTTTSKILRARTLWFGHCEASRCSGLHGGLDTWQDSFPSVHWKFLGDSVFTSCGEDPTVQLSLSLGLQRPMDHVQSLHACASCLTSISKLHACAICIHVRLGCCEFGAQLLTMAMQDFTPVCTTELGEVSLVSF